MNIDIENQTNIEFIKDISVVITSYYWSELKDNFLGNKDFTYCFAFMELKPLFDKYGYENTMNTLSKLAKLK